MFFYVAALKILNFETLVVCRFTMRKKISLTGYRYNILDVNYTIR